MPPTTANIRFGKLTRPVQKIVREECTRLACSISDTLGPHTYDHLNACRRAIWWRMVHEFQWSRGAVARVWQRDWSTIDRAVRTEAARRNGAD